MHIIIGYFNSPVANLRSLKMVTRERRIKLKRIWSRVVLVTSLHCVRFCFGRSTQISQLWETNQHWFSVQPFTGWWREVSTGQAAHGSEAAFWGIRLFYAIIRVQQFFGCCITWCWILFVFECRKKPRLLQCVNENLMLITTICTLQCRNLCISF